MKMGMGKSSSEHDGGSPNSGDDVIGRAGDDKMAGVGDDIVVGKEDADEGGRDVARVLYSGMCSFIAVSRMSMGMDGSFSIYWYRI